MGMNEKQKDIEMLERSDFPGIRVKSRKLSGVLALVLFVFLCCSSLAGAAVVTLTWQPNTEPDLAGYKIYYGSQSRSYDHVLDVGKTNSYSLSLPDLSHSQYVALTAYDQARNESAYSQEIVISADSNDDDNNDGNEGNEENPPGDEIDGKLTFNGDDEALAAEKASNDTYPRITADVNGDDYEDLVIFGHNGVYVALSNGHGGYDDPVLWRKGLAKESGWYSQDVYPRELADVNGDGLADIVAFGSTKVYVFLSTGESFAYAGVWTTEFTRNNGNWYSQDVYPRQLADVNGDGLADIVAFGCTKVYLVLSTGESFKYDGVWTEEFTRKTGNWYSQDMYPRLLSDVNGDSFADIVGSKDLTTYLVLIR